MINSIQDIFEKTIELESLVSQADDWFESLTDYKNRAEIMTSINYSDDVQDMIKTLTDRHLQAQSYYEGCLDRLEEVAETKDLGVLRVRITRLKTIMNTMMEKHSDLFRSETGLEEISFEGMFVLAQQLLNGEKDD